jgi:hypothetical protein
MLQMKAVGNIKTQILCSITFEFQLKEALDKLGSGRMIIDILQKELLTSATSLTTQDNNLASTEGFVKSNPRRKKKKPLICENGNLLMLQQLQPIPVAANRYALLDNLQEAIEASDNHNQNKTREVSSTRHLKQFLPKTKKKAIKKRIVIIGDSHARGLAAEISSNLGYAFEVTSSVAPGARLEHITNLADGKVRSLGKWTL